MFEREKDVGTGLWSSSCGSAAQVPAECNLGVEFRGVLGTFVDVLRAEVLQ